MYADDIAVFAPSSKGVQRLLDTCYNFGVANDIVFHSGKSQIMYLQSKSILPMNNVHLDGKILQRTSSYKYLGHIITDTLCDNADIQSKRSLLYARANLLLRQFHFCSDSVKHKLFQAFCSNVYLISLWVNFTKAVWHSFKVAFNNSFSPKIVAIVSFYIENTIFCQ